MRWEDTPDETGIAEECPDFEKEKDPYRWTPPEWLKIIENLEYAEAILKTENPQEAWKAIVKAENLSLEEKMDLAVEYAKTHSIDMLEMTHYPSGERVIQEEK